MTQAAARHILVDTETACNELKAKIEAGEDFAKLAREHSYEFLRVLKTSTLSDYQSLVSNSFS